MINKSLVRAKRQSGVVLVISLIMLLALTLIGVTSSSVTGQQEKMAANNKDKNLAFQAAEAALRAGEASLTPNPPTFDHASDPTTVPTTQGAGGLYSLLDSATPATVKTPPLIPFYVKTEAEWQSAAKGAIANSATAKVRTYGSKLTGVSQSPVYIIEEIFSSGAPSNALGSLEGGAQLDDSLGQIITYRITAHGWGSNINSVATLQSIIKFTKY